MKNWLKKRAANSKVTLYWTHDRRMPSKMATRETAWSIYLLDGRTNWFRCVWARTTQKSNMLSSTKHCEHWNRFRALNLYGTQIKRPSSACKWVLDLNFGVSFTTAIRSKINWANELIRQATVVAIHMSDIKVKNKYWIWNRSNQAQAASGLERLCMNSCMVNVKTIWSDRIECPLN